VNRSPKLKYALLGGLNKFPHIKAKLVRLAGQANAMSPASTPEPLELATLSLRARRVYQDLKAAMEKQQKESR
jgi:hypothetical protein